jgi:hypothetical protein
MGVVVSLVSPFKWMIYYRIESYNALRKYIVGGYCDKDE